VIVGGTDDRLWEVLWRWCIWQRGEWFWVFCVIVWGSFVWVL